MEYNTGRNRLVIPEYGRNIQKLIEHAITLDDREERNKIARAIVNVMGQLNPQLRDITDFKHKLWDHLFIISDFKLDVDSPYERPTELTYKVKPHPVSYPTAKIKYRHYGHIVDDMIRELKKMEDTPSRDQLIINLANFMKMLYVNWNKDSVTDEVIFKNLFDMSGGELSVKQDTRLQQHVEVLQKNTSARKQNNRSRNNRSRMSNNGGGRQHRKNG
ncbi:MAG TPA: DUF4290 domain-containing protein [Bacteroidia bacterium]|nr:DUF4290 domain-containing protein [Bacteroidia bacterium]